eukprot:3186622-Lingulodinium_polyedra.AAC.1
MACLELLQPWFRYVRDLGAIPRGLADDKQARVEEDPARPAVHAEAIAEASRSILQAMGGDTAPQKGHFLSTLPVARRQWRRRRAA